ncbi:MAG: adenine deaminase [Syntrophobacterales bacterium]|nr:adenine deaminase [Syntrophobacterales bacterium]
MSYPVAVQRLSARIRAAQGQISPDLILKNGLVADLFSGQFFRTDVAVHDGIIVGLGEYDGPHLLDATPYYVAPGFIDGHFHIESSMLSPRELARAVLPHGTTAIVADPHEITNVLGIKGLRYLLQDSEGLPVDFFLMAPSCVPATHLETSGYRLEAKELAALRGEKRILGLAEMMNFPGVIYADPDVLAKIAVFGDAVIDGHAPLLSGKSLNAYVAAGIRSDHECTRLDEAREKLRLGMHIMIREGTQAKNLATLLPLVETASLRQCSLVTDDLHPHDILHQGHLDAVMSLAIRRGLEPLQAIAMTTLNTARYFFLPDRGAVAPGYRADLVLLSSCDPVRVAHVFKDGRQVVKEGELSVRVPGSALPADVSAMQVKPYDRSTLAIPAAGNRVRVIELIPDQILTRQAILDAPVRDGEVVADVGHDILKIAVIERHRGTGNIAVGLVRGFRLKKGALATSVAHDSHNIICVGCTDGEMIAAAQAVEEMRGGLAIAGEDGIVARLPLPIAGLMSDRPLAEIARGWEDIRYVAQQYGCQLREPFMHLSFLALPVIPELKLTDRGLVDVNKFDFVSIFVD